MAKDTKGHGSERRATAIMKDAGGMKHEINIRPTGAQGAKNRGWTKAVSFALPGQVPKFHETLDKAKAKAEKRPGFISWKK